MAIISTLISLLRRKNIYDIFHAVGRIALKEGISGLHSNYLKYSSHDIKYEEWVKQYDTLSEMDRNAIIRHIDSFSYRPLISILIPACNTPEKWLRRAIESIRSQLYTNWELCIAEDTSSLPQARIILEEYQRTDHRIKVVFGNKTGRISAACNSALEVASGDFAALLYPDDELSEHALYMVAAALNKKPYLDLIYSDEDKIGKNGRRFSPYFKPDWNPALLTGQCMASQLGIFRRSLTYSLGGFRESYEGAQDWDMALRISDAIPSSHIHHIPHILYHCRAHTGFTALSIEENNYPLPQSAEAVLHDHLDRIGRQGQVMRITKSYFRIRYSTPSPAPLVSIIIPTRNGLPLLRRCIESLRKLTRYSHYEILVVDNQSDDPEMLDYLHQIAATGIAFVIRYDLPFNYSAINNFAVKSARGEYLCLMNNDIEVISEDWLDEMVSQAACPEVGAVGAKLYYPNDTIQHAGVILGMGIGGVAGHIYSRVERHFGGYMSHLFLVRNFSAITAACLVVRKELYDEIGGLDEKNLPVAFNDVDFCLRLLEHGYRNLWTPFAELYHHESATRGQDDTPEKKARFQNEVAYMRTRWGHILDNDPAYNPNLALKSSYPCFSSPRIEKPWRK